MYLTRKISNLIYKINPQFHLDLIKRGYSGLNGLDKKLIEVIKPLSAKHGYFIELGANDGLNQSNTYKLQKDFGWSGLLIEPSPTQFAKCVKNRTFANIPAIKCAACVPFGYEDKFVEMEEANLMSVAKGLTVSNQYATSHADIGKQFLADSRLRYQYGAIARTLTSLLDEVKAPNFIDLLSLDVEGNELAVLQGLDFNRYRIKWILLEVLTLSNFLVDIKDLLDKHDFIEYVVLASSGNSMDILFKGK